MSKREIKLAILENIDSYKKEYGGLMTQIIEKEINPVFFKKKEDLFARTYGLKSDAIDGCSFNSLVKIGKTFNRELITCEETLKFIEGKYFDNPFYVLNDDHLLIGKNDNIDLSIAIKCAVRESDLFFVLYDAGYFEDFTVVNINNKYKSVFYLTKRISGCSTWKSFHLFFSETGIKKLLSYWNNGDKFIALYLKFTFPIISYIS